jgi:hypothetical protein
MLRALDTPATAGARPGPKQSEVCARVRARLRGPFMGFACGSWRAGMSAVDTLIGRVSARRRSACACRSCCTGWSRRRELKPSRTGWSHGAPPYRREPRYSRSPGGQPLATSGIPLGHAETLEDHTHWQTVTHGQTRLARLFVELRLRDSKSEFRDCS